MPDRRRQPIGLIAAILPSLLAVGCAQQPPVEETPPITAEARRAEDAERRVAEVERQMAERQRHCNDDKRRLEATLKDTQARLDSAQKKLNAVLAIERDMRAGKTR